MTPKTHYATLGVALIATQDQIKRAYRNLARRFHQDLGAEPVARECCKDAAAAHEPLIAPERHLRRDAEVAASRRRSEWARQGEGYSGMVTPSRDAAMQNTFRDFFSTTTADWRVRGEDQQGVVLIELADAYRGATRSMYLQIPTFDSHGELLFNDRQFEVRIPVGVLDGQQLRLKAQGAGGQGGAPAGDLYLEVIYMPHPGFRLEGRDVHLDLPVAPWEAALGASVTIPTPTGTALLKIPPGSTGRQRLRLKGLGLPGAPPGDLYAALDIELPPARDQTARRAWRTLADAFPDYRPTGR